MISPLRFALISSSILLGGASMLVAAVPVVFWASDGLQTGDAALVYGSGLGGVTSLSVSRLPDDQGAGAAAKPAGSPVDVQALQANEESLKFMIPEALAPGVYSARIPGLAQSVTLNRPQVWFVQPEVLQPGLRENQVAPDAPFHIIGKDCLLPGDLGKVSIDIRPAGAAHGTVITADRAEKFSVRATLPVGLPPGRYELRLSNGFGGSAGWSDPFAVEIRQPDRWPDTVFNVRQYGAAGDDTTDDTAAIRAALDAAEQNGGGVVYFPWGTYRLTDWIRIPAKTILRGEERDATILKWPVDEPATEADFVPAAVYGDTSYGVENLSFIARKVNTIFVDLSTANDVVNELRPRVAAEGSHDVFFRHVAFHHWMHCSHPDRVAELWAKRYTDDKAPYNFRNTAIRNFEVSDCLFQGANQSFYNIRNARILRNSFSNGMGYCWTCLGGGASHVVAEENDLRCSSSWGYGMIGMNRIYSARNISHNFVHGEREAMTLDISALPATPAGPVPKGMHPIGGRNIAWFGSPVEVAGTRFRVEGIKAADNEFADKTVMIMDGPGAGQFREIKANTAGEFTIDRPWDAAPTTASVFGLWDLCRYMIVYKCEGFDTSAFAQLYGSYYEYLVDSCTVDRSQGTWGQSGWFVQYRYNTIRYGHTYHPKIGIPGKNRERNAAYGFNGLTDGNLRITKFGSAQYDVPGGKPLFVKDVLPAPVPGVRGCIIRRNDLSYNQRIVLAPDENPDRNLGQRDFVRMLDSVIDRNSISHTAVGINVGPTARNVLISGNAFQDVATPVLAAPQSVLDLGAAKK